MLDATRQEEQCLRATILETLVSSTLGKRAQGRIVVESDERVSLN